MKQRDEMNLESARIGPPLNEMKEDEGKVITIITYKLYQ